MSTQPPGGEERPGERRERERRRLVDLTRREKGLPERRQSPGTDRRRSPVPPSRAGDARPARPERRSSAGEAGGPPAVTLVLGDITEQHVHAVVNAANSRLLGGSGVDGAIHARGGPAILAACEELRRTLLPDGLPPGQAVATTAGELPARWVIHAVGPRWSPHEDRSEVLASAYRESLRAAEDLGARTVAFPSISTGVYGYPLADAARVAVDAVLAHRAGSVREVRFVLFSRSAYDAYAAALRAHG